MQERARRRLSRGIFLAIAGAVLLLLGFAAVESLGSEAPTAFTGLPVFLGLGALVVAVQQLYRSRADAEAYAAEAPVMAQLASRFDDRYVYLRRVRFPRRNAEADALLVGPHGVLVLRIAAASGTFVVRQHAWFRLDADRDETAWERSPTWELARPLRDAQRAVLEEGLGNVPVLGAVVLVLGRLAEAVQPSAAVVPVDKISNYVDYLVPEDPVPAERVEQVVAAFEPYAAGNA